MNLYILRHASAGTRRPNPVLDVKRGLDKEGKQQCITVANLLNSLHVQFDVIASSPLKRALQTASLVGTEMAYESKIMQTDALAPAATINDFRKLLDELHQHENVLIVGHNPNLTQFFSSVLAPNGRVSVRLRKAALARIDCSRKPPALQWLVDTRLLRSVYISVGKSSRRKTSRK